MTTMQDVAMRAGVSAKTVSRVFNEEAHVSEAVRLRVRQAMEELGYVPNMLARTFREGRASVLGIGVPDIADPFFAAIVQAIDQCAQAHGHAIVVTSLGHDPARERSIVDALLRRQIAGLIMVPIGSDQGYLANWNQQAPVVFLDREPLNIVADIFLEDDQGGATSATRHLIDRGHKRIAFIGDSENVITTKRRLDGYREACHAAGLAAEDDLIVLVEPEQASERVERLLQRPDAPTAIFSSNSRTSLEIFPTLQRLDRTGVALVSFGDFPMAAALQPSVTVVDQVPARLGMAAAERLFARLEAPNRPFERRTVFDVELIKRASSDFFVAPTGATNA